jgi:hypothetical protein
LNFWVDMASFVAVFGLVLTGGLIHFVLPAGTGRRLAVLGMNRHDYGEIHFWLAVAAVALLVLHIALHWTWVCCIVAQAFGRTMPSPRRSVAYGAGFFALSCAAIVLLLYGASVQRTSSDDDGAERRGGRGLYHRGAR